MKPLVMRLRASLVLKEVEEGQSGLCVNKAPSKQSISNSVPLTHILRLEAVQKDTSCEYTQSKEKERKKSVCTRITLLSSVIHIVPFGFAPYLLHQLSTSATEYSGGPFAHLIVSSLTYYSYFEYQEKHVVVYTKHPLLQPPHTPLLRPSVPPSTTSNAQRVPIRKQELLYRLHNCPRLSFALLLHRLGRIRELLQQ